MIEAALRYQIDIAIVERADPAGFDKKQDEIISESCAISQLCAFRDYDQPEDAIGGITSLAADKQMNWITCDVLVWEIPLKLAPAQKRNKKIRAAHPIRTEAISKLPSLKQLTASMAKRKISSRKRPAPRFARDENLGAESILSNPATEIAISSSKATETDRPSETGFLMIGLL